MGIYKTLFDVMLRHKYRFSRLFLDWRNWTIGARWGSSIMPYDISADIDIIITFLPLTLHIKGNRRMKRRMDWSKGETPPEWR